MPSARILLVDDEQTVLDMVRDTLEGCGYTIETAASSSEALAKVRAGSFSLIILDLLLPDMNGFLLAQEIRRICPTIGNRILFISGILFGESAMEHIGSIGAGFLSKPFQINSLIEAVDRVTAQPIAS
jgi:CheY-like chemotaxis protein